MTAQIYDTSACYCKNCKIQHNIYYGFIIIAIDSLFKAKYFTESATDGQGDRQAADIWIYRQTGIQTSTDRKTGRWTERKKKKKLSFFEKFHSKIVASPLTDMIPSHTVQ